VNESPSTRICSKVASRCPRARVHSGPRSRTPTCEHLVRPGRTPRGSPAACHRLPYRTDQCFTLGYLFAERRPPRSRSERTFVRHADIYDWAARNSTMQALCACPEIGKAHGGVSQLCRRGASSKPTVPPPRSGKGFAGNSKRTLHFGPDDDRCGVVVPDRAGRVSPGRGVPPRHSEVTGQPLGPPYRIALPTEQTRNSFLRSASGRGAIGRLSLWSIGRPVSPEDPRAHSLKRYRFPSSCHSSAPGGMGPAAQPSRTSAPGRDRRDVFSGYIESWPELAVLAPRNRYSARLTSVARGEPSIQGESTSAMLKNLTASRQKRRTRGGPRAADAGRYVPHRWSGERPANVSRLPS